MSNVSDHQKDYKPNAYELYSNNELVGIVRFFVKRSQHRKGKKKTLKDLDDAKNYLWMLTEKTKNN